MERKDMMKLKLYTPQPDELEFRQQMLANPQTMSYNHAYGGTISFTRECWSGWYKKWIGNNDPHYFYRYLANENNVFVGEVAYHYDVQNKEYMVDVLIETAYRQQGYGTEALNLLCKEAFRNGVEVLNDCIATDNPSIELFRKFGFIEIEKNSEFIKMSISTGSVR